MITVNMPAESQKGEWNCIDLIGHKHNSERTAFVGTIGKYEHELFIVTYSCIALARDPFHTWDGADFEVDYWCDLEITAERL